MGEGQDWWLNRWWGSVGVLVVLHCCHVLPCGSTSLHPSLPSTLDVPRSTTHDRGEVRQNIGRLTHGDRLSSTRRSPRRHVALPQGLDGHCTTSLEFSRLAPTFHASPDQPADRMESIRHQSLWVKYFSNGQGAFQGWRSIVAPSSSRATRSSCSWRRPRRR